MINLVSPQCHPATGLNLAEALQVDTVDRNDEVEKHLDGAQ